MKAKQESTGKPELEAFTRTMKALFNVPKSAVLEAPKTRTPKTKRRTGK